MPWFLQVRHWLEYVTDLVLHIEGALFRGYGTGQAFGPVTGEGALVTALELLPEWLPVLLSNPDGFGAGQLQFLLSVPYCGG